MFAVLKRIVFASLLALGFGATLQAQAAAINLTTPGTEYSGGLYTLGFAFTVNSNSTITSLGVYDSGADGLNSRGEVGLWDTAGNLLASTTVPAGTVGELDGLFRYVNISGFNLIAGTQYIIGAFTTDLASSLGTGQGGTGSIDANVNVIVDRFSNFNSTFSFPDTSNGLAGGAWLGANFRTGTVPEPGTLALLGLGLAGFAAARRRK
jgi:hypothetical protein